MATIAPRSRPQLVVSSIVSIALLPMPAHAQSQTDAVARIAEALAKLGPMAITTYSEQEYETEECKEKFSHSREGMDYTDCRKVKKKRTVSTVAQGVLTPGNLTLSFPYAPELGDAQFTGFPNELIEDATEFYNCTRGAGNYSVNLLVNASRSTSVTIDKSISGTISGTATFEVKPFGVGGQGSITVSATTGSSESKGTTQNLGYAITSNGSVSVDPKTAIVASLRSYRVQSVIPFQIRGVVDADLSPNDKGYKHASEVLSEADRTFIVEGKVTSQDNSRGRVLLFEIPKGCSNRQGQSENAYNPARNSRIVEVPTASYRVQIKTEGGVVLPPSSTPPKPESRRRGGRRRT